MTVKYSLLSILGAATASGVLLYQISIAAHNLEDKHKYPQYLFGKIILPTQAQVTFFYDSLGLPMGTAIQMDNATFHNVAKDLPLGVAQNIRSVTLTSMPKVCHWMLQTLLKPYYLLMHHSRFLNQDPSFRIAQRICNSVIAAIRSRCG
jgi:hypothetical protein